MKKLLLVALIILTACHQHPQDIATRNIAIYLKKKLHDPASFQLISVKTLTKDWSQPVIDSGFVRLDSGLTDWSVRHRKFKFDRSVIEAYVDSLDKARPDLVKENARNLKLIESGKLNSYWTNCTFSLMVKGEKKTFFYTIGLDTDYNVIGAIDLTSAHFE